jgi:predicted amidohydrolase
MIHDYLRVAVVQTSLDPSAAWVDSASGDWRSSVRMSDVEEELAIREVRHYLSGLRSSSSELDVVVFPELSIPVGFERRLKRAAEDLEAIIIAGFDYQIVQGDPNPKVCNDALVVVPRVINGHKLLKATSCKRVGKTYPAPAEERKLKDVAVEFDRQPTIWTFDSPNFGTFGVAVCYDFLDVDRIAMYRNKIQTLFILALNKDTNTFDHLAEAISRMIYCNVVVCNCGHFGGSYAVAPFKKAYKRAVYKNTGQELANAQIVKLPLKALKEMQEQSRIRSDFKSLPPGFTEVQRLTLAPQSTP